VEGKKRGGGEEAKRRGDGRRLKEEEEEGKKRGGGGEQSWMHPRVAASSSPVYVRTCGIFFVMRMHEKKHAMLARALLHAAT